MAPELACVSWANKDSSGLFHWKDPALLPWLENLFKNELIVGHNVAYDTVVLCANFPSLTSLIFKAYEDGRITDTLIRQQLLDIADGSFRGYSGKDGVWRKHRYDLDYTYRRHCGKGKEEDQWQTQYGTLLHLPLDQWPSGAKHYPVVDAVATRDIWVAQGGDKYIPDEYREAFAFFCLQLTSVWGLKADPNGVAELEKQTVAKIAELKEDLTKEGLVRADGSKNMKVARERIAAAWAAIGENDPPKTPSGDYQLNADACTSCEDPVMSMFADYQSFGKVLSTDCEMLRKGTITPIHTHFKMLETTRVGSAGPNVQNIRRLPGIRECFTPRSGWCFADVDYPILELRTLSEVCYEWLGHSKLGDVLNAGEDPHCHMGAAILGLPFDEFMRLYKAGDKEAKAARQLAKVANYGFPGGLGAETFVSYAYTGSDKQIRLTVAEAQRLRNLWLSTWPEMLEYFALIKSKRDPKTGYYMIEHVHSGIVRACSSFTKAANSPFQSMGASCAKAGLVLVTKECYVDRDSPLFGARVVNMIHDQLLVEIPFEKWGPERTSDAAFRVAKLFADGAKEYLTRVDIHCDPILSIVWSKDAKQLKDSDGQLKIWHP